MLDAIKAVNVGLRFLLELGVLVALGYWGYRIGRAMTIKIGLAIALPISAAVVWILLGAPGSTFELHDPVHLVLEILFFGAGAAALFVATCWWIGIAFAALFVVNRALMYLWGQ